jgi:hypothetical protein
MGFIGKAIGGAFVKKDVTQIFDYRSQKILELLS